MDIEKPGPKFVELARRGLGGVLTPDAGPSESELLDQTRALCGAFIAAGGAVECYNEEGEHVGHHTEEPIQLAPRFPSYHSVDMAKIDAAEASRKVNGQ